MRVSLASRVRASPALFPGSAAAAVLEHVAGAPATGIACLGGRAAPGAAVREDVPVGGGMHDCHVR